MMSLNENFHQSAFLHHPSFAHFINSQNILPSPSCFFQIFKQVLILCLLLTVAACSPHRLVYQSSPSPHALNGISNFHIEQFQGEHANLFQDLLIKEIYRIPNFTFLKNYPDGQLEESVIISGEVMVYSHRDEKVSRTQKKTDFVQRQIWQYSEKVGAQVYKTAYEFIETSYEEPIVHRFIDLEIQFIVTSASTSEVLYDNLEKATFRQSYIGEDAVALLPIASGEMERLGEQLIHRFLDKLNPSQPIQELELETGTMAPFWVSRLVDLGHPGIIKGNRYAIESNYKQALKNWNYVIFTPQFGNKEKFVFTDKVFGSMQQAKLPRDIIRPLLKLRNQELSLEEIDTILVNILSRIRFQEYGGIIKTHARISQNSDRLNMASAHYNLGVIYRLQEKHKLSSYHFAQANLLNPQQKYAQHWSDVMSASGDYASLGSEEQTLERASKQLPPKKALLKPSPVKKKSIKKSADAMLQSIQPVELPSLDSPAMNQYEETFPLEESALDLE